MRTAVAIAILVAAGRGLAGPPARSQTTCSDLHSTVTSREFALSESVSKIASQAIPEAGNPTGLSKVCTLVQAFHKDLADLKSWLNAKKSLCVGEAPPNTKMADAFVKIVRNSWKGICR